MSYTQNTPYTNELGTIDAVATGRSDFAMPGEAPQIPTVLETLIINITNS